MLLSITLGSGIWLLSVPVPIFSKQALKLLLIPEVPDEPDEPEVPCVP